MKSKSILLDSETALQPQNTPLLPGLIHMGDILKWRTGGGGWMMKTSKRVPAVLLIQKLKKMLKSFYCTINLTFHCMKMSINLSPARAQTVAAAWRDSREELSSLLRQEACGMCVTLKHMII